MKKITLEKVLWFVGRLIRAVFLIAWNLTRVSVVLFLALRVEDEHCDEASRIKGVSTDMRDWEWE